MKEETQHIGYLRYSGKSVDDGFLDLRKSAEALLGFDEILRFSLYEEYPIFKKSKFEIPVKITKGSWAIEWWWLIVASPFAFPLGKKVIEDGLLETGPFKDLQKIFQLAMKTTPYLIKIAKHINVFKNKKNAEIKTKINKLESDQIITIINSKGEFLNVPKKYFDVYKNCPENLFSKNASIIEKDRILEIGYFENGKEEKESITEEHKDIFYLKEEDEIILPELEDGQEVKLDGIITKGNEKSNTIGFEYKQQYVLTCKPKTKHITSFKHQIIAQSDKSLFPEITIIGKIDRSDKSSKKPQIIFTDIIQKFEQDREQKLF